jgi:integrase
VRLPAGSIRKRLAIGGSPTKSKTTRSPLASYASAAGTWSSSASGSSTYPMPRTKNVRRPVASEDRYKAILAVANQLTMAVGRGKRAVRVPTYLREILTIAWGTGRRISAILQLRYTDLRLADDPPAIVWPSDTDKLQKEWRAPISAHVREAINRIRAERQLKGLPFLFPNPNNPDKPISKERASEWLRRAEDLAGLEHIPGGGWHMFRNSATNTPMSRPCSRWSSCGICGRRRRHPQMCGLLRTPDRAAPKAYTGHRQS